MSEIRENQEKIKGIDKEILVEWGRLFRLSNQSPPQELLIDGIVISAGDWTDRVQTALDLWRKYADIQGIVNAPFLIPSGLVSQRGWIAGTYVVKQQYNAPWMAKWFERHGVPKDKILVEPNARNSKELADFSLQIAWNKGLQNLILTVSPYYLPRAYMTFVSSILSHETPIQTRLFSVPTKDLPWDGFVPDEPKTRFQQIPGEIARIHTYREKGDIATEEQLESYIKWLNSQPA